MVLRINLVPVADNKMLQQKTRNKGTAIGLFGLVFSMIALAFASEPLYRLFCQVTGYGGTTQVTDSAQVGAEVTDKVISIRFDANVNHKLPWHFKPLQREMRVNIGAQVLAFYEATNLSPEPIVGTATFNVTPYEAASHFNKIECFCFTEQVLKPGQTVQMPVSFFIDPAILNKSKDKTLSTITLSYTFFRDQDQSATKVSSNQIKPLTKVSY